MDIGLWPTTAVSAMSVHTAYRPEGSAAVWPVKEFDPLYI